MSFTAALLQLCQTSRTVGGRICLKKRNQQDNISIIVEINQQLAKGAVDEELTWKCTHKKLIFWFKFSSMPPDISEMFTRADPDKRHTSVEAHSCVYWQEDAHIPKSSVVILDAAQRHFSPSDGLKWFCRRFDASQLYGGGSACDVEACEHRDKHVSAHTCTKHKQGGYYQAHKHTCVFLKLLQGDGD